VGVRKSGAIATSGALASVVEGAVPPAYRHGRIHSATRTFQALRIAVNGELERLPFLLEKALATLAPSGKLAVISFHSLEDRIVKFLFKEKAAAGGGFVLVNKKAVQPSYQEAKENPPSRSAKLRVIQRTE
jgi:16S rRNA (cytosine1402-N4)-methyltransferase